MWVGFFWPILITTLFIVSKKSVVRKSGYFASSLISGDVFMFLGNFITVVCAKVFHKTTA